MHAGANPFSTQRIHALPYVFADGETLCGLHARFWRGIASGWRRQVLAGPHGSGKSTLLRELGADWAARRCQVLWLDGTDASCRVRSWAELAAEPSRSLAESPVGGSEDLAGQRVLLIDSGERLTRFARLRLWWRLGGCPTLSTSHRERGARVLYRCRPRLEVFLELCDRLLHESGLHESGLHESGLRGRLDWNQESLGRVFVEHGGDMRASFFALYERMAAAGG